MYDTVKKLEIRDPITLLLLYGLSSFGIILIKLLYGILNLYCKIL